MEYTITLEGEAAEELRALLKKWVILVIQPMASALV